jgi:hypothetical protein
MTGPCDKCGAPNAILAPHTGKRLCDPCFVGLFVEQPATTPPELPFPHGRYDLYANDDDVIGLTVARTSPHGYFIVRTKPPFMDAFDEFRVGQFLAWCLTNAERLLPLAEASTEKEPT